MKKRALATIFLFFSTLLTFAQAEEKNGWYMGTKLGWSHVNPLKYNFHVSKNIENNTSKESLKAPIVGFFLGYEFNPYLGFEIENDTNGFKPYLAFHRKEKNSQNNSLQLSTKLSYPVRDNFYIYTKLGGLVFWENLTSKQDLRNVITKESSIFPSISLGAEYVFNKNFFTRLDYTWKNSVKNIIETSIKPSLGNAVLSFGWKFGNTHSDADDLFLPYDSKTFNTPYNTPYTVLSESVNFPFNSTELKPVSYDKLNKLDEDIKNMRLKNLSIVVIGHSDKMGTEEYNQRLSEDRAYSIKNYLTSRGFSRNQITIQGMGNLYPLTDQVCKDIENRPLLISCLAPDRRVEIEVLSK